MRAPFSSLPGSLSIAVFSCLVLSDTPAVTGQARQSAFQRTAAAETPTLERVSVAIGGGQANENSFFPVLSADARFVAFASGASNLVAGDTNRWSDIFVHDRATGVTTRESVGPGGVDADGPSFGAQISADGRFVGFMSNASNLVPGVTGSPAYVRDRRTGVTYVVSASTAGTAANEPARDVKISADGRFVAFSSLASNLVANDTNGATDVFLHDLSTRSTTRESVTSDGMQPPGSGVFGWSIAPSLSGDGRYVAFTTSGLNLAPGDTSSAVILRDRLTGQVTLESVGDDGLRVRSGTDPQISNDGRYLLFHSSSTRALYLRDRATSRSTRVNACVNPCTWQSMKLSADGRYISAIFWDGVCRFFPSCTRARVAVLDRATGEFVESLTVAAVGANSLVETTAVTGAERTLALATPDALIARDTNGMSDIYVMRLGPSNVPGVPTNLTASVTGSAVTLTWNAPAAGGAPSDYVIEAGSSPGSADLAHFGTRSLATTFSASGVRAGTYYVRVKASNGDGPSLPSNEAMFTVTSPCSSPAAPNGLSVSVSGSTVTLTWAATIGAASYILEVGSGPGRSDTLVTDLNSSATALTASAVAPGTYFVRMRSTNACGTSGTSTEASVIVR